MGLFFHFARVDHTIDIATLAQFFNRMAAIMCKPCNPGFDHVIPVMFEDAEIAQFGPLEGRWNKMQAAHGRTGMSGIFIDSKCHNNDQNWATYVEHVCPVTNGRSKNFDGETVDNVFLSVIQDFGEGDNLTEYVEIGPSTSHEMTLRQRHPKTQIRLVMRGVSEHTYECLKWSAEKKPTEEELNDCIRYLRELRRAKIDFLEVRTSEGEEEKKVNIERAVRDFATVLVKHGADRERDAAWAKERKKMPVKPTDKGKRKLVEHETDRGTDAESAEERKEAPGKGPDRGKRRRVR